MKQHNVPAILWWSLVGLTVFGGIRWLRYRAAQKYRAHEDDRIDAEIFGEPRGFSEMPPVGQ